MTEQQGEKEPERARYNRPESSDERPKRERETERQNRRRINEEEREVKYEKVSDYTLFKMLVM